MAYSHPFIHLMTVLIGNAVSICMSASSMADIHGSFIFSDQKGEICEAGD
jgi:hypothetical protein